MNPFIEPGDSSIVTRQLTTFNYEKRSKTIPIPCGQRVVIGEVKGSGILHQIWLTFPGWFWMHWNPEADINPTILKNLILRIYWDGADKPAVSAPVGDFFGIGLCEVRSYANLFFGMSSGGFYCKFPMPYRKGFRIEIENRDEKINTDVFMNALYQEGAPIEEEAGYFHAVFNTGRDLQKGFQLFEASGAGKYVGCALSLQGKRMNELSFLEAPEYVYVDQDWEVPRIIGTGLEDYFLGGWYFREGIFQGPYHGVVIKDPLRASVAMNRIHDQDAIHFKQRIRFTFESPWEVSRINPFFFSSVAYLYLNSPSGITHKEYSCADLLGLYRTYDFDHQSIP